MGNKKVDMVSSLSPQQQGIESLLGNKISQGMGQGVTPYTGAIASNPDMMNLMAANIMSSFMGGSPYQLPTQQMGQNYGAQAGQQGAPQMGGGQGQPQMPQAMPQGFNPFQAKRQ